MAINRMKIISVFFMLYICFFASIPCIAQDKEKEVLVSGSAEGNPSEAGELALARALREAVRQGAGVDVLSETKVENFQMESDKVMTSSFGYVKEYKLVSQEYKDGIYTVKIKAKVGEKTPGMDNVMALRLLVRRAESPRVMIECDEKISGVEDKTPLCAGILDEMAKKTGLETFDKATVDTKNEQDAKRAEILGDTLDMKVKRAGITSTCDMKIEAKVTGSVGPVKEPFPDMKTRDIDLGVELKAVWADTGETIATVSMPTKLFKDCDGSFSAQQLARACLAKALSGEDPDFKNVNAYKLFQKIIAKWTTELDLGAKIRLEFKQIDKPALDKLMEELKKNKDISYVWRREFDARLFSVLEIETRLSSEQTEDLVLKCIGKNFTADQVSKKNLRFIPKK